MSELKYRHEYKYPVTDAQIVMLRSRLSRSAHCVATLNEGNLLTSCNLKGIFPVIAMVSVLHRYLHYIIL